MSDRKVKKSSKSTIKSQRRIKTFAESSYNFTSETPLEMIWSLLPMIFSIRSKIKENAEKMVLIIFILTPFK